MANSSVPEAAESPSEAVVPRSVFLDIMRAMVRTVERVEPHTAGHNADTAAFAIDLARRLKLSPASRRVVHLGALLHDIGKIGVPSGVLLRPKKLTPAEYALVKEHPMIGWDILSQIDMAKPVATVVRQHHERLDGSGYPDGLSNGAILQESLVVAIADVTLALEAHRTYRRALDSPAIVHLLEQESGPHFPGTYVNAAIDLLRERQQMTRH